MTKSKLMSYVGKKVCVRLFDEDIIHGVLKYTDELSDRVWLHKKGYFTIGNIFEFQRERKSEE